MLSFTDSPGNLFPRLGSLGYLVKLVFNYQQTLLTAMTSTTAGVVSQYNSESDLQAMMGSAYISQLSAPESVCSLAQQIASATLNRMVFRDLPQLNQTLQQSNIISSINELLVQMRAAGATVLSMTIGITPNPIVGIGNGVIAGSSKRPFDGLVLENSFQEVITFTCTQDSYTGGATVNNEQFAVTGEGQETDIFAFDWPLGSNCAISINAIDGDTNNGSGNLLTNSGFATWANTPNVPDNWQLTAGTAGVNTMQSTGIT